MNITYPPHKNVTIPLRRRGGPSGHGRVGVVPADPAPRQFECPPKADVSRTTVVTAFSAITSRYTLLSSRTRSDACPNFIKSVPVSSSVFPQHSEGKMYRESHPASCTLHHPPCTSHHSITQSLPTQLLPTQSLNHSATVLRLPSPHPRLTPGTTQSLKLP